MKALTFDSALAIIDAPKPAIKEGETLIKVIRAGICNTDIEITKGYIPGFSGILGHEFWGIVEESDDNALIGKRATAEINNACGKCEYCLKGQQRHCRYRSVLGIINSNGAMAEYVCVPTHNVITIPDQISDTNALFIEPLAAAFEILDQITITEDNTVLLLGDGKLALLIAHALSTTGCNLSVVGKHESKLKHIKDITSSQYILPDVPSESFDIVVEASGNSSAFNLAQQFVKSLGTIVLKSTYSGDFSFNPSTIVVNEITLLGSRCGRFSSAVAFLQKARPDFSPLLSQSFPLSQAIDAFEYAQQPGVLKVQLQIADDR